MNLFSKIIVALVSSLLLCLPLAATFTGWGVSGERNQAVMKSTNFKDCPPYQKDVLGNCKASHRSYFGGRNYRSGSGK